MQKFLAMIEELTTKMHSEFTVSPETEIKHGVWGLLSTCEDCGTSIDDELKFSILTKEQVEKYKASYYRLKR